MGTIVFKIGLLVVGRQIKGQHWKLDGCWSVGTQTQGQNHGKAVSSNGLFRPVIVINGKVTGLWKRTIKNDKVIIEAELFKVHSKTIKRLIERSSQAYGHFLGIKAEVMY